MAAGSTFGNVRNGASGYGVNGAGGDKRNGALPDPADSLFSDRMPHVPDHELFRDTFIQKLSRGGIDQRMAPDGGIQFPDGSLLADIFCRTGREMDFPECVQKTCPCQ